MNIEGDNYVIAISLCLMEHICSSCLGEILPAFKIKFYVYIDLSHAPAQ